MAYKFDPLKYKKTFDGMFGAGEYDAGVTRAGELGRQTGEAKLLRQAMKEAAEKEKKKKEKEEEEKSKKAKENENLKKRIEASGGSTEKKQSAIGKALNLDPDNNLFFDALDLLSRPLNAAMNVGKNEEERRNGDSKQDKYLEEMRSKPMWETGIKGKFDVLKDQVGAAWEGFSGDEKTIGSDVLKEAGMKKGIGRGVAGFGLDVAVDPLNLVGAGAAKLIGKGASKVGGVAKKVPGVETATNAIGDVFSNKRIMKETLEKGKTTDSLAKIDDNLMALRSQLSDKSLTDISKARLTAGKDTGVKVGKTMEKPLSIAKPLDFKTAPSVMNTDKVLPDLQGILKQSTSPTTPLARASSLGTKTTHTNKINIPEPTDKEVRTWLQKNDLPGGEKKGRVSKFNKELYKTENEQALRASYQVETKVQKVLASTPDIDKAAKTLTKDPVIKNGIKQAAQTLTESNEYLVQFMRNNNIKDMTEIEGYLGHFATKEAQKYLKDHGDVISSGAAKIGGDGKVITRKIHENVTNANTVMKRKTGVDQFFTPDAFTATAGRQHNLVNYIVAEMAKKQVLGNKAVAKVIPSGSKGRKGYTTVEIDGKNYEMTKGAADTIKRYDNAISDEGLKKLLNGYDKVMNTWKKAALFSAGYHARNMIGNTFNMAISDMNTGTALAKQTNSIVYLSKLKAHRNGRKPELKGVPERIVNQYEEFVSTGLRATGIGADFADPLADKAMSEVGYRGKGAVGKTLHEFAEIGRAEGVGGKVKQTANSLFESSRRLGDEADEVARFTLYRHLRDKGKSVDEATKRVKEVLYDYNDLTVVEREGFKRLAPFYTFTRKNLEFQLKNFAANPVKYNRLNSLIKESYAETEMNEEIVPEYLKDALAVPMMGTDKLLNAALPAADLARVTSPLKMGMDMLTPALKVPLEIASGNKFFNGAPIEEYEGQQGSILGMKSIMGMPISKNVEYGVESAFSPLRNLAGAQQQMDEGQKGVNPLLKAIGGELRKPYDEEAFQLQADYKENDRLQGIKKKMEKEEGKEVMTIQDMKDQGIATNEEEEFESELLGEYSSVQQQALLQLKKKVEKGDPVVAVQVRGILEKQGLPEEVIDYIVNY